MIAGFFSITPLTFIDAILALWLLELGMSKETVGLGFSVNSFFYGLGAYATGILCDKYDRRILLIIFLYLTVISDFMTGPSAFLSFPVEIWLVMVGLGVLGIATGGVFVPIVPELIAGVVGENKEISPATLHKIKDKASALNGTGLGSGFIIAPILGGALVDSGGF